MNTVKTETPPGKKRTKKSIETLNSAAVEEMQELSFEMEKTLHVSINQYCKERGVPVSSIIRALLVKFLRTELN